MLWAFLWHSTCQNLYFAFVETMRAFKASWETLWCFWWSCDAARLFDLPPLCPHHSLCLSLYKSVIILPLFSHPSSAFFFMLAPWSGHPRLRKLPDSQAAPQPSLASSFLLLTHSTSGNKRSLCATLLPLISLTPSLQKKKKSHSFSPPPLNLLYLSCSPAFPQLLPDVGPLYTFFFLSSLSPASCRTSPLPINPLYLPRLHPRNRQVLHIYFAITLISTRSFTPSPLHTHTLWSIALTWQTNNNSSQTFVRLQCMLVFFLTL